MWYKSLLEKGLIPDFMIRAGIRGLLKDRLREEDKGGAEQQNKHLETLIAEMNVSPVAIHTEAANEQHYEVPPNFYLLCLGKNLKYSSCLFETGKETLDEAEDNMLALTVERAGLEDGMDILELGCGWGSLTLYMAKKFPNARITGVSNSAPQREFIMARTGERGLKNVTIVTCDMNTFDPGTQFDRIVSVEMIEHMRNYRELLRRVSTWMRNDAKMFVHIFTHREYTYKFEVRDESDWMSKYFFTGGIMPADRLLYSFQDDLRIEKHWNVNGMHYGITAEWWLRNMDKNKNAVMQVFRECYGAGQAVKWFEYWRIFFMSCEELWKFRQGKEWGVSHYLLHKKLLAVG